MADLIVVGYDDEHRAEEVRLALAKLQQEYLIDLADAAVVVKDSEGKIKLKQAVNLPATGALSGGFWGLLIGALFLNPLLGVAVGAASGALAGALSDVGVDDNFMRELSEILPPSSSALFVLVRKVTPDKVLAEVSKYGGRVLRSSLSKEDERALQEVLTNRGLTPASTTVLGTTPAPGSTAAGE
ncbi:DUF1269 domain-containing protein [Gloeobacter violaceus]|uniref:Gll1598 protein n=1 Tax=Gloeobacter violaceus (strain ATCC 29082 / PCC 7421) TaxID=251221 RepID=Q7NK80_GLOVI|nr:DUF1269 domain-containing protein [Gloeobacter violaceus]BAC89539.1 gll1598 [Gloeobacter violaceus PCC 7421]